MKSLTLKIAVLAALSLPAVQATAAGFATLPTSGASAYVQCRVTSNFGSTGDTTLPPAADSTCVAPNGVNVALPVISSPETGFTIQNSNISQAVSAFAEQIAQLNEAVFRNSGTGQCIYAKQLVLTNAGTHDYNPLRAGVNRIEVNDFVFGGYTGAVSAAYAKASATNASVFRIGRTYTSVQMQAKTGVPGTVATGFKILPSTAAAVGTDITGVGQTATPGSIVPGAGQQDAPFSPSWVDFTTDATNADEDGGSNPNSANMYIKQACANATTTVVPNSFVLRQTGQETQPWVTVTTSSRSPSSTLTK